MLLSFEEHDRLVRAREAIDERVFGALRALAQPPGSGVAFGRSVGQPPRLTRRSANETVDMPLGSSWQQLLEECEHIYSREGLELRQIVWEVDGDDCRVHEYFT